MGPPCICTASVSASSGCVFFAMAFAGPSPFLDGARPQSRNPDLLSIFIAEVGPSWEEPYMRVVL